MIRKFDVKGTPMTAAITHFASAAREVLARAEYMLTELRAEPKVSSGKQN